MSTKIDSTERPYTDAEIEELARFCVERDGNAWDLVNEESRAAIVRSVRRTLKHPNGELERAAAALMRRAEERGRAEGDAGREATEAARDRAIDLQIAAEASRETAEEKLGAALSDLARLRTSTRTHVAIEEHDRRVADAYKRGAEAMRERAAQEAEQSGTVDEEIARAIRALPLTPDAAPNARCSTCGRDTGAPSPTPVVCSPACLYAPEVKP